MVFWLVILLHLFILFIFWSDVIPDEPLHLLVMGVLVVMTVMLMPGLFSMHLGDATILRYYYMTEIQRSQPEKLTEMAVTLENRNINEAKWL